MAKIELDRVTKRYSGAESALNAYPALDHVTLTLQDGETISVVGPSGCGKSTLLKVVAGLEPIDQGRVLFNGADVTHLHAQDRNVGMVFQDYALYPAMKSRGNLGYFFQVHQASVEEQERRVKDTAALMGVDFNLLLGQMPETLSGGQKQRVAIARCIVRFPNVFLMDEPICNLDAKLRESTRIEIRKLLKKFQVSTLYVTHDQQEAIFMGDRIAVMRSGRIEQLGTFDELYYTPFNDYVARFIGTPPIALLPVTIDGKRVHCGTEEWRLPDSLDLPTGAARLGVRSESWLLDEQGIPLSVSHVEPLPTEQAKLLYGAISGQSVVMLLPNSIPVPTMPRITPRWEQVYLFEAAGEATLHSPEIPELF